MTSRILKRTGVTLVLSVLAATSCQEDADGPAAPDPVIATVRTGMGPLTLTASESGVWVELHRENRVARIDPETDEQEPALPGVSVHCDLKAARDSVWASIFEGDLVTRFDASSGAVLQKVRVENACSTAVDGRSLWVTSPDTGTLHRLVEGQSEPVEQHEVGRAPFGIVVQDDALWIVSENAGGVLRRFDRASEKVSTVGEFRGVDNAFLAFDHLWVSARDFGNVWKLDPTTGHVVDQTEVDLPVGMVEHGGLLWLTTLSGNLLAMDPQTLELVSETELGHGTLGPPIVAFGSLWTAALDENVVLRVDLESID